MGTRKPIFQDLPSILHISQNVRCQERTLVAFTERSIEWLLDFETRPTACAYYSVFADCSSNLKPFVRERQPCSSQFLCGYSCFVPGTALRRDSRAAHRMAVRL